MPRLRMLPGHFSKPFFRSLIFYQKMNPFIRLCTVSFAVWACSAFGQTDFSTPSKDKFIFSGGATYIKGDYGLSSDTTVWVAPFTAAWDNSQWVISGTLPWIWIKGPASVIGNASPIPNTPSRPTTAAESGHGDFIPAVTYRVLRDPNGLHLDLSGRVKLPTADKNKGLGTGETDYYAQADVYQSFDRYTPFATVGYRWLGSRATLALKNGVYASGGVAVRVVTGTSVGASYEWRAKIVDEGEAAEEVAVFVYHQIDHAWAVQVRALRGFTTGGPNVGVGTSVSYTY